MASGGGAEKGSRTCNHIWNLNICIEKVDAKCWLAEMTLVMTSLPLALVFQCLFIFALVSAWRWLTEIWQLSWWGTTGELEKEFKFQRPSCKLSFLLLPPLPECTWELAHRLAPFKYFEANSIYYNDLKCSFKNTVHAKRISISTAKVCFEELFLFKL